MTQSVRKSVNEGVDDLEEFALLVSAAGLDPAKLPGELKGLADSHDRYTSIFVLDGRGRILASVGDQPAPEVLDVTPPYDAPGMQDAKLVAPNAEAILQFAPVPAQSGQSPWTVVAVYDPTFLRFALEPALPGDAWIVNDQGQVLAGLGGSQAFSPLPSPNLRSAAIEVTKGQSGVSSLGESLDSEVLIGYAPVYGTGPAGQLGWGIVTWRSMSSFALPQTEGRRQGLLVGVIIGILALLIFGWLYAIIVSPVARLQRDAERLSHGDRQECGHRAIRRDRPDRARPGATTDTADPAPSTRRRWRHPDRPVDDAAAGERRR